MILTEVGPVTAYRMHAPRLATAPTSGAGAAAHGGRANRPGTPALYLSLEPLTAISEYQQLSPLMPPGTRVGYTVCLRPLSAVGRQVEGLRATQTGYRTIRIRVREALVGPKSIRCAVAAACSCGVRASSAALP
jgi:RES domain